MTHRPPLPKGYRYGEYAGMLTVESSQGSVSIDLKKPSYALGLTTITLHFTQRYTGGGWKTRLIMDALAALQNAHGFIKTLTRK